jgi:hypothetical protein
MNKILFGAWFGLHVVILESSVLLNVEYKEELLYVMLNVSIYMCMLTQVQIAVLKIITSI